MEAEASSVGTDSRSGKQQTNIGIVIAVHLSRTFEQIHTLAAVKTQNNKYCNEVYILCVHLCAYW